MNKAKRNANALRYIATKRFEREKYKRHIREQIALNILTGAIAITALCSFYVVWISF